MKQWRQTVLAVACVAVWTHVGIAPAAAGKSPANGLGADISPASPLGKCVAAAMKQRAAAWSCLGGTLTVGTGEATKTTVVAPDTETFTDASDVSIAADDYDTWCEADQAKCHRPISDYISETKGNHYFGNSDGIQGEFDEIIRTNLNGRQAWWRVWLIWDGGRNVKFNYVNVNCREAISYAPDSNCGRHRAFTDAWITSTDWREYSGYIYGNKLNNSNDYYAFTSGQFTPSGAPTLTKATLRTKNFNCYGRSDEDICYFP